MEDQEQQVEKVVKKRATKKKSAKKSGTPAKKVARKKKPTIKETGIDNDSIQDIILQPSTIIKRDKLIHIINKGGDLTTRVIYERVLTGCDFVIQQNDTRNFTAADGTDISGANIIKVCGAIKNYLCNH